MKFCVAGGGVSRRVLLATTALASMALAQAGSARAQTITFSYTGSSQTYDITTSGSYLVTVAGAQGGNGMWGRGGAGAVISGDYTFTAGEVLNLVVGGQGGSSSSGGGHGGGPSGGGGGGGGGFVFDTTANQLIVVAGGGGGSGSASGGAIGGQITTSGSSGSGSGAGAAGTNGGGGQANPNQHGGGGGGFLTAGQNSNPATGGGAYASPTGGTGGEHGGYGGGGGGSSEGGGGGGYSGGGGGSGVYSYGGGGGGSYEASGFTLVSAVAGSNGNQGTSTAGMLGNLGNGYITFQLLQSPISGGVHLASSLGGSTTTAFQGGTLQIDTGGQTYSQAFTVDNSGSSAIDQAGKAVTFSGVFSDATSGGAITITNSSAGGGVTFTGANTYTGATTINGGASLALSGAGAVARSSIVTDNGVFDVSGVNGGATSVARLSGGGQVNLGGANLTINQASDTFSGTFTGTGGLTLAGGTETLSGASTIGSTTVAGGSLVVTGALTSAFTINSGATLQGGTANLVAQGAVTDNGTLVFDQPTNAAFANAIVGSGALIKQNAGLLVLNGQSALGQTTVAGGDLQVGDIAHPTAELASSVTVASGAVLSGHGAIVGAVSNGGVVSPGGSIGVLTIQGDYVQAPSATLSIQLNPTTSSTLAVTGNATLAGSLVLLADQGLYRAGTRYTVVAAGSLSGAFSQVSLSNNLPFTLAANGGSEVLTLTAGLFPTAGGTANQNAAGQAFVNVPVGHADLDAIASAVASLPTAAQQQAAAGQMGGEAAADTARLGRDSSRRFMGALQDQLFDDSQSGGARSAWGRGFGDAGRTQGDGDAHGVSSDGGGTVLGGSFAPFRDSTVGVTVAYDQANLSLQGLSQSALARLFAFGAYAEQRRGVWFADAAISTGVMQGDTTRTIAFAGVQRTAEGQFSGTFSSEMLSAGVRWRGPGGLFVEPSVSLAASQSRRNAYGETGAGDISLDVSGRNDNAAEIGGGLRVARPFILPGGSVLSLEGEAAWMHDVAGVNASVQEAYAADVGDRFTLAGAEAGANTTTIGAGAVYSVSKRLSFTARYDRTFNDHQDGMQVSAGFRLAW